MVFSEPLVHRIFRLLCFFPGVELVALQSLWRQILKVRRALSKLWRRWQSIFASSPYGHYRSPQEESWYWKEAERGQQELSSSNANSASTITGDLGHGRHIVYYAPRMIPECRGRQGRNVGDGYYPLPVKSFVKWHWLAFPEMVSIKVSG